MSKINLAQSNSIKDVPMAVIGIQNSYNHPENGMTLEDMTACGRVATQLNEVIHLSFYWPMVAAVDSAQLPHQEFSCEG
jgi:hypothetical protein